MGNPSPKMVRTQYPGIYQRGSRYVVVTYHRGKQHKAAYRTLAQAREAKSDRTGSHRQAPAAKTPFDKYAQTWVKNFQGRTRRGLDPDTRESYRRALEARAIPMFGSTPLRDIDRSDIDKLIRKMQAENLSPSSISKYLAGVRAMFSDAVERGHVSVNPALRLRINAKAQRAAEPKHGKVLARSDLAAVLAAIPEQHRLIFDVLAGTGCRISEALGLDWSDLEQKGEKTTLRIERQFYRGTLKPNAKTEAGERTLTLDAGLASKLWAAGADETGPMFHTRTGRRLNDRNLRRVLDKACEDAGVAGVSFHTLRHSHGSMLIEAGWTIPQVSKRLGHASPAITAAVYSHATSEPDLSFLAQLAPVSASVAR